jgi:hypothetical protein
MDEATSTKPAKRSGWTPEQWMQLFREIVTAILAFLLLAATMALTYRTFGMAGNEGQMKDAMGVLTLLFGIAGVVVGYYFGRIPGDARAVQAHETTQAAMKTMQGMSESSSTSKQMAEKTQQIQADLNRAMKTANMTTEKLRMGGPAESDEIIQLRNIVLLLQQEIGELQRIAAR